MTRTRLYLLSPALIVGLVTLFVTDSAARADDEGSENSLVAQVEALENRIDELEETVAAQQAVIEENQMKLAPLEVSFDEINGLAGPHLIITGVNVHIRSGAGATDAAVNGLGNLIVGYNEAEDFTAPRIGSHNLVVGRAHGYTSFGGLVAGAANDVTAPYASVSGGRRNLAGGFASSVGGGLQNYASGFFSSVSGGRLNEAGGNNSSVSGGLDNLAGGSASSVSGGFERTAPGDRDWVAGSLFEDD